ncbi:hypothetical protein QMK19_03835 [Streptomyces sp. H10-C2]|uniref:hypothetical protein n=1 Tax=unclassified Streptomyces TaxID=2593676 RepID=UPI0024B8C282|nr:MULTISPECIES: hypothetical protein [unclassified Streptomyces]MDJ0345221.1 hypothetical protein [Streptomyces sp. PH10-H1]MDJ0368833.1 hypothetical protein [Streptomyces sp. H10-C2]
MNPHHDTEPRLDWLPAEPQGHAVVPAGVHGWDAVRIPRFWANRVLDALGDGAGAVIHDGHCMYLLVAHGTADDLRVPAAHDIAVLGTSTYVAIPGIGRHAGTPGIDRLRWRTPPTPDGDYLTNAGLLQAAIDNALGPRRAAS